MTDEERGSFERQLKAVSDRAKRDKATITGLTWRDGRLTPTLVFPPGRKAAHGEPAPPVAEPPPIPKKGKRGLVQTELPL